MTQLLNWTLDSSRKKFEKMIFQETLEVRKFRQKQYILIINTEFIWSI